MILQTANRICLAIVMLCLILTNCYSQSVSPVNTTLRLPLLIGDNMVLQRDKPVAIWGWAASGETVTISMGKENHVAVTDEKGLWRSNLSSKAAGGPYSLVIKTAKDSITLKNIMFGDVWVCSGQSNMQFELKKVNDAEQELKTAEFPLVRLLQVARKGTQQPEMDIKSGKWQACNAQTVANFSAVAYFFGTNLLKHARVPIGLIDVSWGGSTIEAWMSADMLQNYPQKQQRLKQIEENRQYVQDRIEQIAANDKAWVRKFRTKTGHIDSAGNLIKHPDTMNWSSLNLPNSLNAQKAPVQYGFTWYRKLFAINESQVSDSWELHLGPIIEISLIYLNGQKLGESLSRYGENKYAIPKAYLKTGQNELLIYTLNESGLNAFTPNVNKLTLTNTNTKSVLSLAGRWWVKQQSVHGPQQLLGARPTMGFVHLDYTLVYNAMIAPLTNLKVKGVLWYQGETNADKPDEYGQLLNDLIKGWRAAWHNAELPFYIVQLANYNAFTQKQKALAWPRLQEVQKEAAFFLKNSGLAVIYDIGTPDNIHPKNKKDVGTRLALVVRNKTYNENSLVCYGPIFKSASPLRDSIILSFEKSTSAMVNSTNSSTLNNFKIAGADKVFYPANAIIRGDKVVVFSAAVLGPVYIRYAFDSNPIDVNFYNKAGLPAVPFRTDDLKEW